MKTTDRLTLARQDQTRLLLLQYACWMAMLAGICFRLYHFFYNRSFFLDESMLSVNFLERDYRGLTDTLEYFQQAPIGFLWFQEFVVSLLGNSERAFRFLSLSSGILSVLLFYRWTSKELPAMDVLLAVVLFSCAYPLIYHSAEAKQYAFEILASVLSFLFYSLYGIAPDRRSLWLWAVGGALLVWFSYSVIFTLACIGFVLTVRNVLRKDYPLALKQATVFACWLISFIVNYLLFMREGANSEALKQYWILQDTFMPAPSLTASYIKWFRKTAFRFVDYPLGLGLSFVYLHPWLEWVKFLFIGFGCLLLGFVNYRRNAEQFFVLTLPLLLVLLISGFQIYPFYQRSVAFLAPPIIFWLAMGTGEVIRSVPKKLKLTCLILTTLITGTALFNALHQVADTTKVLHRSEAREALEYIEKHFSPGDIVIIHTGTFSQYWFYQRSGKLNYPAIQLTEEDLTAQNSAGLFTNISNKLDRLNHQGRIWFLLAKQFSPLIKELDSVHGKTEANYVLAALDKIGDRKQKKAFLNEDVYLYLFQKLVSSPTDSSATTAR